MGSESQAHAWRHQFKTAPPALLVGKRPAWPTGRSASRQRSLGAQNCQVNAAWYDIAFGGGRRGCSDDSWTEIGRKMSMSCSGPPKRVFVLHNCPADPHPRNEEAVIHGMGVWFRGSGLGWLGLHAQYTVYLEFIKGYRSVYRADNDEMPLEPPYLGRRWGGGSRWLFFGSWFQIVSHLHPLRFPIASKSRRRPITSSPLALKPLGLGRTQQ